MSGAANISDLRSRQQDADHHEMLLARSILELLCHHGHRDGDLGEPWVLDGLLCAWMELKRSSDAALAAVVAASRA